MMRPGQLLDPIAERLLELQRVSGTQWLLRAVGAGATIAALLAALGGVGPFAHIGATLVSIAVAVALLVQCRSPDSDLGVLAPLAILLSLLGQGELTTLRAAGVGGALLIAHTAFALAATIPAHGVFTRGAWRLAGTGLLPVLALSLVGGLLVAVLAGVRLGPWMMVLGVAALIALFVAVLPRER